MNGIMIFAIVSYIIIMAILVWIIIDIIREK